LEAHGRLFTTLHYLLANDVFNVIFGSRTLSTAIPVQVKYLLGLQLPRADRVQDGLADILANIGVAR
jgi:hypothetical protein